MIAADDDRRLDGARPHELVEPPAGARSFAIPEPADAGRQALVLDMLLGRLDPADEPRVVGKLLNHGPVGRRDVPRVARQRDPTERAFPFAEKRTDVGRYEARKVERTRASTQARLGPKAVAVVENLGTAVEKRDHPIDMPGHAFARAPDVSGRIVEPQLLRVLG